MYSWRLDPNLSGTSDLDYLGQLALHLTDEISRSPNSSELYFRRANAYLDSGRFQDAIDDYTKAIDLSPLDAIFFNNRGIAHRYMGDFRLRGCGLRPGRCSSTLNIATHSQIVE